MHKEYLYYLEEKSGVFNLLMSYQAFENLILSNYPFEEEWIIEYLERNRNLNLSEQIWFLNSNENLKIDWKKIYDLETNFANHSGICHNKSACDQLKSNGIEINYSENEWLPILPKEIQLDNSFTINTLSDYLEKREVETWVFFESKEIWEHCFKKYVDEEMIGAWSYKDRINKEIQYFKESMSKEVGDKMVNRFYENQKMKHAEYDDEGKDSDNISNQAFEGDADNFWNVE